MASQRNTGAFVVGGVIGGLIGAAITLWKTPKSGQELRAELSAGRNGSGDAVTYRAGSSGVERERRFSNPVLSFVEKATAPIVGVELGKLAKDDPQALSTQPVRPTAADAKAPTEVHPVAGEPVTTDVPASSPYTSAATTDDTEELPVVNPEETETHDSTGGSAAHAATTDELTHPTPDYARELDQKQSAEGAVRSEPTFPDLPSGNNTNGSR